MKANETVIRGDTLAQFRRRATLSQEELAEATAGRDKVSLATIKRIEATKDKGYRANTRIVRRIADVLRKSPETLAQAPSDAIRAEPDRVPGHSRYKVDLDGDVTVALQMVEKLYGIPVLTQFVMAPLFAALISEASLAWRRLRLRDIEEAASKVQALGRNRGGFRTGAYRVEEAIAAEAESIEKRDVFGTIPADHSWNEYGIEDLLTDNPLVEYLRSIVPEEGPIELDVLGHFNKTTEGMPEYWIGAKDLAEITNGDRWAAYAIRSGRVRIADIPENLLDGSTGAERAAWLAAKVTPDERESQEALILDL